MFSYHIGEYEDADIGDTTKLISFLFKLQQLQDKGVPSDVMKSIFEDLQPYSGGQIEGFIRIAKGLRATSRNAKDLDQFEHGLQTLRALREYGVGPSAIMQLSRELAVATPEQIDGFIKIGSRLAITNNGTVDCAKLRQGLAPLKALHDKGVGIDVMKNVFTDLAPYNAQQIEGAVRISTNLSLALDQVKSSVLLVQIIMALKELHDNDLMPDELKHVFELLAPYVGEHIDGFITISSEFINRAFKDSARLFKDRA